jgi:hypothetical protein
MSPKEWDGGSNSGHLRHSQDSQQWRIDVYSTPHWFTSQRRCDLPIKRVSLKMPTQGKFYLIIRNNIICFPFATHPFFLSLNPYPNLQSRARQFSGDVCLSGRFVLYVDWFEWGALMLHSRDEIPVKLMKHRSKLESACNCLLSVQLPHSYLFLNMQGRVGV